MQNDMKKCVRFIIPFSVTGAYSLNQIGEKYSTIKKKRTIEQSVFTAISSCGLKSTVVKFPVEINIYYDTQIDIDNCGFVSKAIIDALKVSLLGGDDNKNHVVRLTQQFWDKGGIGVEVKSVDKDTAPRPSKRRKATANKK